jgi:molybdenum cofactor synthesis domain-containing protein
MTSKFEILSLNVSRDKGTAKQPVETIAVDGLGIVGDAHAGRWHRQLSLLDEECIGRLAGELGRRIAPGEFGENVTVRGLPARAVAPLDRLLLGEVELEVSQIGKQCHGPKCAIFQQAGRCVMPAEGLFARVVRGGSVHRQAAAEHRPRPLRCLVITLSDRAAAGDYADRSGPRVCELLEVFFATRRWHTAITTCLLSDDPEQLRLRILAGLESASDLIFTTGGTGLGPRDRTPATVAALCDRLIPGIMEHVRAKYGAENPAARLSRAVAGVAGQTQIYALPGSVRAVEEYLPECLATFEHLLFMLHGLDVHG